MEFVKRAFKLTNKNIMLVCGLIIFQCLSSVYIILTQTTGLNMNIQILILYALMVVAFFAGFFNIIKYNLNNEIGKLRFLEGVGDYFLPMLGIFSVSFIFYSLGSLVSVLIAEHYLGGIKPIISLIANLLNNPNISAEAIKSINPALIELSFIWLVILWAILALISFILLFWVPVLYIDSERNIFKSFFRGIKFLGKNFVKTLLFSIIILIVVIALSLLESLTASIPAISAIFSIVTYYFTVVFLFGIFLLYKEKSSGNQGNN